MKSKNQILLFSIVLILITLVLMFYKVKYLNFPLFADDTTNIWNIQAKITFEPKENESAIISLALPSKQSKLLILNEESTSADYGYSTNKLHGVKKAIWSKREVKDKKEQVLYYSIDVIKDNYYKTKIPKIKQENENVEVSKPIIQAANSLLNNIYPKSADSITFTSLLIKEFNKKEPSQAANMIQNNFMKTQKEKRDTLIKLIKRMKYKARTVGVLYLKDKQRNVNLTPMLEVYKDGKWYLYDIDKGLVGNSSNIFIWQRGTQFLLDAEGVNNSSVKFSVIKNIVPARSAALMKDTKNQSALLDFSLFTLPNASQNTFKLLLLVPLGALVVVFMRVIVGLKTSGTFMPILLSMAFIETHLVPGILMFILVVTMGLFVRSYLSHLNLLLVARISSVLIVVVAIMAFVAILSQKLGLSYATSITFFPIIILSWTIERMSILWEEEGAKEVFIQGSGSLTVSILAYFAMTNSFLSFITFNFPEVLLAVLGVIILLGRYSGYRLSELYRFKSMVD